MRAALRSIVSYDVNDLAVWEPDGDAWGLHVRLLVGPADGPGEESFDLTVCSPEFLAELARREGPVDGRHRLIMDAYDWPGLQNYLRRRVERCDGETWKEIAQQLTRFAYWEFEDYHP